MTRLGPNLILSSTLAFLSYLPFEFVAKFTISLCAALFIFDPFPPVSRLVSLIGVVIVGLLKKIEQKWSEGQREQEEYEEGREDGTDDNQGKTVNDAVKED